MKIKFQKLLSLVLTFILTFGIYSVALATDDIPEGYTPVYTAEDLDNIRNNLSGKYILMNDIDLSAYFEWSVIGDYGLPFSGELDGNGYSIIGLKSKRSLLGWVENAVIKNLGIVNCNIIQPEETASSSSSAGAFADNATNSSFEKCFVTGSINVCISVGWMTLASYCSTGGLVGVSKNSTFVNCYNHANIHFTYDKISSAEIGGLVGDSYNTNFSSCYSTGKVSSEDINKFELESSNIHKGGLVGSADEITVFNCCYYRNDMEFAVGKEQSTPNGTKSLSDAEMKNQNSFAGFDFDNVWEMSDEEKRPVLDFEKNSQSSATPYVSLIDAKIVKVPLKNRISFKQSPKSPEGIKIELTYSDGTIVTEEVVINGDRYYVNGELLEEAGGTTEVIYGITSAGYFMNEGNLFLSYKYLALPSLVELFKVIFRVM